MKCSNCGTPYSGNARFCRECGARISTASQEPELAPVDAGTAQCSANSGPPPTDALDSKQSALDPSTEQDFGQTLSDEAATLIMNPPAAVETEADLPEIPNAGLTDLPHLLAMGSLAGLTPGLLPDLTKSGLETSPSALTLEMKAGKRYRVGQVSHLELRIRTRLSGLHHLVLRIMLPSGREEVLVSDALPANTAQHLEPLELAPSRPGELLIKLCLSAVTAEGHFVSCRGHVMLVVESQPEIHVEAGRDIIGLDLRELDELSRTLGQAHAIAHTWTLIELDFDSALQIRKARATSMKQFAGTTAALTGSGPLLESSQDFVIIKRSQDQARFFVFAGTALSIGRDSREVQLALRAGLNKTSAMGIGRLHCRLQLTDGIARLQDVSRNGTRLNGARIPERVQVRILHGDRLSLAETVDFQIELFADIKGLTALAIKRDPPGSPSTLYLLTGRGIPLAAIAADATGWLIHRKGAFCLVNEEGGLQTLDPGPLDPAPGLLVEQPSQCPSCRRPVYLLPEAQTCPACRKRSESVLQSIVP
jgi:hypothetical protein